MKASLRALFAPLLNPLERGDEPYVYKPLNRKILLAVSLLFSLLCAALVYLIPAEADKGYLVPVVVFGLVARSEERRVGNECRDRSSRAPYLTQDCHPPR